MKIVEGNNKWIAIKKLINNEELQVRLFNLKTVSVMHVWNAGTASTYNARNSQGWS